ncbi:MAG TPA: lysoplasmalogenase [Xanthomonadales bacterium]|nr:lysoplasmalogenase [Xanthomonadales bacterium]
MPLAADRRALHRWLTFVATVGLAYVASLAVHPYPLSYAVKAIPALTLCALAIAWLRGRTRVLMAIAFAAAAAGDVFLDLDRTRYLPHGLGCFLVTQVAFTLAFRQWATWTPSRVPLVALLVVAELALLVVAWPNLGPMRIAVIVYLAALVTMTATAVMVRDSRWIAAGALLFLLSDSLIGINRFIAPFPASTAVIVTIYLAAMLLIARGVFGRDGALAPARS